jgi:hypothetical protein
MSYRAILSPNAQDDLRRMPPPVSIYTLSQLANLERNPTALSEPSHFPFREKCQIFSFDYDFQGKRYFFNVLFEYGADEQTLFLSDIAWQVAEQWYEG